MSSDVVLRLDVADIANPRQISRALSNLVNQGQLVKLGYGTYAKLVRSKITHSTYLKKGILPTMREALTRLNVSWEASDEEKAYQEGRSRQMPVNPVTKLKARCRRQLKYRGMELKIG